VKHPNWPVISLAVGDLFAHLRFEVATPSQFCPFFHTLRAKDVLVVVEDKNHVRWRWSFPVLRGVQL